MLSSIDIEARKLTGISFQQTDEIDESGVNLARELDVSDSSPPPLSSQSAVLHCRKQS